MTDADRASLSLIIAAADCWLPVGPADLGVWEPLYAAGLVEYWPDAGDGPGVTLTPLGAHRMGVEIQERVEKRAVRVTTRETRGVDRDRRVRWADRGQWWATADEVKVRVRERRRREVVPKWWPEGKPCPPPVQPQHRHEVPLWFPERVVDPSPGPLDALIAAEEPTPPPRVIMGCVVQPLKPRRPKTARAKPPGPVRRTG